METLNYEVLKKSGYNGYIKESAPEKVMQFGEGNFLRAFVDYFFDCANEKADWNGKVVLVQPIAQGLTKLINDQEGLYTLYLRGSEKGEKVDLKRVISSVSRCINPYDDFDAVLELAKSDDLEYIVSNTTEAGIVHESESKFDQCPPISFPAKLTRVLYERYKAGKDGVVVLSCELIDNNGKELQKCVNEYIDDWGLEEEFKTWINEKNTFCSTLVDRIVPGRVRDAEEVKKMEEANGYHDELIDVGEIFGERGAAAARFDFDEAGSFETDERAADDDGVDLHAVRDEVGRHFGRPAEQMNDEQRMHRYRKPRGDFHKNGLLYL